MDTVVRGERTMDAFWSFFIFDWLIDFRIVLDCGTVPAHFFVGITVHVFPGGLVVGIVLPVLSFALATASHVAF